MKTATTSKAFDTRREYVEWFINKLNEDGEYTVLRCQYTRFEQVNYLAVRETATGVVGAMVMCVSNDTTPGHFKVKFIDEIEHPRFYDANARTLSMLSETTDENALAWREQCRATQAAAAQKRRANRVAAQRVDKPYRLSKKALRSKYAGCRMFVDHPALFERCLKANVLH